MSYWQKDNDGTSLGGFIIVNIDANDMIIMNLLCDVTSTSIKLLIILVAVAIAMNGQIIILF